MAADLPWPRRQGNYRILYKVVGDDLIITVVKVGNRGDGYRVPSRTRVPAGQQRGWRPLPPDDTFTPR